MSTELALQYLVVFIEALEERCFTTNNWLFNVLERSFILLPPYLPSLLRCLELVVPDTPFNYWHGFHPFTPDTDVSREVPLLVEGGYRGVTGVHAHVCA